MKRVRFHHLQDSLKLNDKQTFSCYSKRLKFIHAISLKFITSEGLFFLDLCFFCHSLFLTLAKPSSKAQPAKKKVDLFDDEDDEDDLFGTVAAPAGRSKAHSNVGLTVEGYDEEKEIEERKHQDEERIRKASVEKKVKLEIFCYSVSINFF